MMEFHLIYQGSLPAEGQDEHNTNRRRARATDKHKIRKLFHLQLRELWDQHPDLRRFKQLMYLRSRSGIADEVTMAVPGETGAKTWLQHIADSNVRCNGNRFVPLVREEAGFTCSLDILFLRRDNPGGLIEHGGDVDNRIKVLFDALKMPADVAQLGGLTMDADEDPFFCLLEDDKLITKITVTTDRLVIPLKSEESIHDVLLLIHVTVVNPSALFADHLP